VGVHLHASGSADQSGQEAGQNGAQDPGQPGARLLGRSPTRARLCQHH